MKKILVPTDFSQPAQFAVDTATAIAKKARAEVILLHVIEEPGTESFNVEGEVSTSDDWNERLFMRQMIEKAKNKLGVMSKAIELSGVSSSYKLRIGELLHGIQSLITNQQVDLIVMGTSGRSEFEEFVVGSNTEKVVRNAWCPVLTVHQPPSKGDLKNIVYASSLSDSEQSFSEVVKNTQALYNATIHLVRINTPMNFTSDNEMKPLMEKFARKLHLKNYTINVYNDETEEEGIIHFANSINADLLALATHGRTGVARLLAGSIAEGVATHSQRPVLTQVTNFKKVK
jgi:nucleotide-binding universal stress UspA family protein